jgi:hypothetical protein
VSDPEAYLGDGVTVTFDCWYVWLRTPRANGVHEIALGPEEWAALVRFEEGLRAQPDDEDEGSGT